MVKVDVDLQALMRDAVDLDKKNMIQVWNTVIYNRSMSQTNFRLISLVPGVSKRIS